MTRRLLGYLALAGALTLVLVGALALQAAPSLPAGLAPAGEALAGPARRLREALQPGRVGGLRLTRVSEPDLNALLAHASQGQPWRSRVQVEAGALLLHAAVPVPWVPAWLNLRLHWDLGRPQAGTLPPLRSASVGRLPLPAAWVERALHRALSTRLPVDDLVPLLQGWQAVPGQLRVVWRWQPDLARAVVAQAWQPDERAALVAQATGARTQPAPGPALAPVLQARAQQALARGGNAAAELKALLVVLSLQTLGRDLAPWLPEAAALGRLPPWPAQLAGREDMAQHFVLAALLAWQGGERTAAALGLAKELADRRDGSGFSFNDLAADAAGNRLGRWAAADPAAVLQRLAAGVAESDFFPRVDDLPEFLSEAGFRARYGAVGSPAYDAEMARIRARVEALPLYQGKP